MYLRNMQTFKNADDDDEQFAWIFDFGHRQNVVDLRPYQSAKVLPIRQKALHRSFCSKSALAFLQPSPDAYNYTVNVPSLKPWVYGRHLLKHSSRFRSSLFQLHFSMPSYEANVEWRNSRLNSSIKYLLVQLRIFRHNL